MKFLSLQKLAVNATATLKRFPFPLGMAAMLATVSMVFLDFESNMLWVRLMLSAQLGIPLALAAATFAERRQLSVTAHLGLVAGVLALLAWYFFTLPNDNVALPVPRLRSSPNSAWPHTCWWRFLRSLAEANINGFWQFNRSVFLRFLTALLYSVVLYAGLALALAAVDHLLGIDVDDKTYVRLFIIIGAVFNTWFFLGGVPPRLDQLEGDHSYPNGLKIFTQYVLIPLIVVYLTILTAYLAKILITRVWPSGWIGYLVSSVSTAGILALLLVHPIAASNKWVHRFARGFYVAMLPALGMLLGAIYQRVHQYGITEPRYFLLVLALWMTGISVYFIITRGRNIKVIPMTLCLVAAVTSMGPWDTHVRLGQKQLNRLRGLLESNNRMLEDRLQKADDKVSMDDRREISACLRYLSSHHGLGKVMEWIPDWEPEVKDADQPLQHGNSREACVALLKEIDVNYTDHWVRADSGDYNYIRQSGLNNTYPVHESDYFVEWRFAQSDVFVALGDKHRLTYEKDLDQIEVRTTADELVTAVPLAPFLEQLFETHGRGQQINLPKDQLLLTHKDEAVTLYVYVTNLYGRTMDDGHHDITNLNAFVFVKFHANDE